MNEGNGEEHSVRVRLGEMILLELDYVLGAMRLRDQRRYADKELAALWQSQLEVWGQVGRYLIPDPSTGSGHRPSTPSTGYLGRLGTASGQARSGHRPSTPYPNGHTSTGYLDPSTPLRAGRLGTASGQATSAGSVTGQNKPLTLTGTRRQATSAYLGELGNRTGQRLMIFEMLGMILPADLVEADYAGISGYLKGLDADFWAGRCAAAGADGVADYLLGLMADQVGGIRDLWAQDEQLYGEALWNARLIERLYSKPLYQESFWKWLDIFMRCNYLPWRAKREARMAAERERYARFAGGERMSLWSVLALLPGTNALRGRSFLRRLAYEAGHEVVLWVEPFGLYERWCVMHGRVIVSAAEPGVLFRQRQAAVERLAMKSEGLSNVNRLGILRLARHFNLHITELAAYMGLARPTVSLHVKKLREAGLLDAVEDGRSVRHGVNGANLREVFDDLRNYLDLAKGANSNLRGKKRESS